MSMSRSCLVVALFVIVCVTSAPIEDTHLEESDAGTSKEKSVEKRNGHPCYVQGYVYQHGEIFTYPGASRCIKYRCEHGGWSVHQAACDRNGRCVNVGSVIRDGCRSLQCTQQRNGNYNYYRLEPTVHDMCDAGGTCVQKNVNFEHQNCQTYRCVDTANGGYDFQKIGGAKCKDDYGNCISVGSTFAKYVNGHYYTNCVCLSGGGYRCHG